MNSSWVEAAGLIAAYTLGAVVGDLRRWHPVAGYGRVAGVLERVLYRPDRRSGAVFAAITIGVPVGVAYLAHKATSNSPLARLALATANLLPFRLTALLAAAFAPAVDGSGRDTWRTWRRFGNQHPFPNSGQCEAAFAGALGVRLSGTNVYFGRSETRPVLGDGVAPTAQHVRRVATLSGLVGLGALALAVATRMRRG